MGVLAWTCAIGGLLLGGLAALVPGFPGAAVALLGLAAFAGLTDFAIVSREALILAALIAGAGTVCQLGSPFVGSRALGGTAGAATGAALGATLGVLVPVPGFGIAGGFAGALILGLITQSDRFLDRFKGAVGVGVGCLAAVLFDLLAVVGVGAVLAASDFYSLAGG